LVFALTLSACGFHLRGAVSLPWASVYVKAAEGSNLAADLRRQLAQIPGTSLQSDPDKAELRLELLSEGREKDAVSVNAQGRVREYALRLRVVIQASTAKGKVVLPPTTFVQKRDLSFNETVTLAKESEEALLYRDMQTDIIQSMIRRMAAVPGEPAAR
jgi:LPS-assembly lipoprotein